ncbi:MAG: 6-bladed beta-propeller [Bacteroidetes bacterium]|nr:6-bladed beta-propeller [Bacteroidota bacterium]
MKWNSIHRLGILVGPFLTSCRAEESDTRVRFLLNLCHCAEKAPRLLEWRPVRVCASSRRIIQVALTVFFITVLPSSTLFGQPRVEEAEIAFTEILRLGEDTDENAYLFGRIVDLAVDSKDRILIADHQPPSVAVFSVDGEWLGSVGGVGEGPGEYVSVGDVDVGPSDSVYVMDWEKRILRVYDPTDFTYVRQIRFPYDRDDGGAVTSVVGVSDHGPIMRYGTGIRPENVGKPRHSYVFLTSWAGERIRELACLPSLEMYVRLSPDRGPVVQTIKFARYPVFRLSASQLLYSGWNAEIDILVTSLAGDTVRTIRWPHDPVPLTRDDIPARLDAEARKMYPEFKPAYRSFVIDDQDNIWIKDYVEAPASEARWQVLDPEGRMIGQVLLPRTLTLYVIDTANALAYGTLRSESGEYMVVVYSVDF